MRHEAPRRRSDGKTPAVELGDRPDSEQRVRHEHFIGPEQLGRGDVALKEIYYNPTFIWTNRGAPGFIDFFSVIAHETGHGLSLAHFGKVFITKKDQADGIQIADIKYAPKALMNAVYVQGRDEIRGSDNGSFCQIWANSH